MGDAPPIARIGEILLPGELLAGHHVPKPELCLDPSVRLLGHPAGDERLRVDDPPVGKTGRRVGIRDLLDEGLAIDRLKQAGPAKVVGDDAGDIGAALAVRDEIGDRDRDRLDVALRDVDMQAPLLRRGRRCQAEAGRHAKARPASATCRRKTAGEQ